MARFSFGVGILAVLTFATAITAQTAPPYSGPYTCNNQGQQTQNNVTDQNGVIYDLRCNTDIQNAPNLGAATSQDFNGCFSICDNNAQCWGFSHGSGNCFLKGYPTNNNWFWQGPASGTTSAIILNRNAAPVSNSPTSTQPAASTTGAAPAASSSNSYASGPPFRCPTDGSQTQNIVTDAYGVQYDLRCNTDIQGATNGPAITIPNGQDFNYCFQQCDQRADCIGWAAGGPNCYLKTGGNYFFQGPAQGTTAAIRVGGTYQPGGVSSSSPRPPTTTTTTTTTPTTTTTTTTTPTTTTTTTTTPTTTTTTTTATTSSSSASTVVVTPVPASSSSAPGASSSSSRASSPTASVASSIGAGGGGSSAASGSAVTVTLCGGRSTTTVSNVATVTTCTAGQPCGVTSSPGATNVRYLRESDVCTATSSAVFA